MTALEDGTQHGVARELDDAIRAVVVRLSRPHASGGDVIERAAILAEGGDAAAIVAWIIAHAVRRRRPCRERRRVASMALGWAAIPRRRAAFRAAMCCPRALWREPLLALARSID